MVTAAITSIGSKEIGEEGWRFKVEHLTENAQRSSRERGDEWQDHRLS
jgi:hypothetical protein